MKRTQPAVDKLKELLTKPWTDCYLEYPDDRWMVQELKMQHAMWLYHRVYHRQ